MKGGLASAGALSLGGLLAACGGDDDDDAAPGDTGGDNGEAPQFTGTLRVTGLGVDLIDPIREAAEAALGFSLAFDVTDTVTGRNKVITQPDSLDIFSGYFNDIDQIWPSGNMIPVETSRITRWSEVTSLYKTGRVNPDSSDCSLGDGDAPFRKMYTTEDGEITTWADPDSGEVSGDEPQYVTMSGGNFNMDSMGYNAEEIQLEPDEVNWDQLFNPEYRGRVAILNDPSIGMQDVGNAAVQAGIMQFEDLGNMTREEIDQLIQVCLDLKRQGHFRAFWTTFDESVNLMASGEVVIESMWSPAVSLLQAQGHPTRYAAPSGGFRGWAGGMGIMGHVAEDPSKLKACYDYLNWWHEGEAGAIMMRQGYYNVVQETSREYVSEDEWNFWIDGQAAPEALDSPFGEESIAEGLVRDGGSFVDRACNYSSWNSLMDEQEHQVERWNEFLAA
ncbi:MAG TPA: extracellular solute-binding protein [Gaiellaceae bacterium]|nr:extracellular solute-binding protein [Gaiellaceae bacterium]